MYGGRVVMTKKKRILLIVCAVIILFLALEVCFNLPRDVEFSGKAYSYEGDEVSVEMSLRIYRLFMYPAAVKGTITVNGKEFDRIVGTNLDKNFFEKVIMKYRGEFWQSFSRAVYADNAVHAKWYYVSVYASDGYSEYMITVLDEDTEGLYYFSIGEGEK